MPSQLLEHRLPNGLHVQCETLPGVQSAAVAFLVRTGSRHEHPHEHGVSHFLEHMCFKGTHRRDWRAINVRFDDLGAIYNAFTGKEHTVYYGWLPAVQTEPLLELLSDMMRPALPPDDYETERNVILEEIAMSGDSFDHHVSDFLHQVCFAAHPLAHEILGEKETIEGLPRQVMLDYLSQRYAAENMNLIAVGAVDSQALLSAAGRYCGNWNGAGYAPRVFADPKPLPTGLKSLELPQFQQQSIVVIYPAIAPGDPDEDTVDVLTSVMGGANSRCYWNIVQKGIASQAGVAWLAYEGVGLLAFYADGDPQRCDEMYAALRAEIDQLREGGVRDDELQRVKNRQITQLALESENPRTRLMQIIDDLEGHGHVRSSEARLSAIGRVSTKSVASYLERCPIAGEGLVLSVGPREWCP
jgi:predicted Zn-dependent peptidase